MTLRFRPAAADDLPRVHELVTLGSRGMYDAATLKVLPDVWRDLLRDRCIELHLFIDDDLPPASRIQGVASGVFVQDAFADALLSSYEPQVASRVMAREGAGAGVVLRGDDVARGNAGDGLSAVACDFAFVQPDWSIGAMLRWAGLLNDSLRYWIDGWRVRLGLREIIGRDLRLLSTAMGARLFHKHVRDNGRKIPPRQRRYLMGMTREQASRLPASLVALTYFSPREPRLGFTPAEQNLLLLALRNHSDSACAEVLGISEHTVKQRWRQIFERVAAAHTEWFPRDREAGDGETHRGVEKRRHLLAYLRHNMAEVRPRL